MASPSNSHDTPPTLSTDIERVIPREVPIPMNVEEEMDLKRMKEDAWQHRQGFARTRGATEPASAYRTILDLEARGCSPPREMKGGMKAQKLNDKPLKRSSECEYCENPERYNLDPPREEGGVIWHYETVVYCTSMPRARVRCHKSITGSK